MPVALLMTISLMHMKRSGKSIKGSVSKVWDWSREIGEDLEALEFLIPIFGAIWVKWRLSVLAIVHMIRLWARKAKCAKKDPNQHYIFCALTPTDAWVDWSTVCYKFSNTFLLFWLYQVICKIALFLVGVPLFAARYVGRLFNVVLNILVKPERRKRCWFDIIYRI